MREVEVELGDACWRRVGGGRIGRIGTLREGAIYIALLAGLTFLIISTWYILRASYETSLIPFLRVSA